MKLKIKIIALSMLMGVGLSGTANAADFFAAHPDVKVLFMTSDIYQGNIAGFECENGDIVDMQNTFCAGGMAGVKNIKWSYQGDVYAPAINASGEMVTNARKIGTVAGSPSFDASFFALGNPNGWGGLPATMPWTCDSCDLTINGTTFKNMPAGSAVPIPLDGRAFVGLGPVANAEQWLGMRMGGCSGVEATADATGPYAGMWGTICLNGTIEFDQNFNGIGSSNCVLVLQKKPQ